MTIRRRKSADLLNKTRATHKHRNGELAEIERRIEDAKRKKAQELDLSFLDLDFLPESIGALTQLRSLKINSSSLRTLPESFARLTELQDLQLMGSELLALPDFIGKLLKLQRLQLSGNSLNTLPESIGELVNLQYLFLGGNSLSILPESIGELIHLRHLDLYSNKLTALPESIDGCTELEYLDVSENQMSSFPTSLSSLTKLQHLFINNNKLTAVPGGLAKCTNLRSLHISLNNLTTLPIWIGDLTSLQYLSAGSNMITELPDSIGRLTHLKLLSLSDNPLVRLPESMVELAQLEGLHLGRTDSVLIWMPDQWSWTATLSSALEQRGLKSLPEGLRRLGSIRELYLHGQRHLRLPPEIVGPSWHDVHDGKAVPTNPATILDYYFRTRGQGAARPLNEAKMILVGRGGVGKTSLINRLVSNRFDTKQLKTDGIFITPWMIRVHDDDIKLNIWDFGGQEIMHSTHQFFLTKRSLYVMVLNAREGEQDSNVEYWLRLIESFGGDSPVIVVTNKIADHLLDLNRRGLRQKFPAIKEFIQTDCESGFGIEDLRKAIVRETDQLEHSRDLFPANWFIVKEKLANLREHEGHDFISFARYQSLCAEHDIQEAVSQETLVSFLHDLGVVVNFRDDPRLAEMHVLNPEWVTNGIYKILNAETLARKQGELHLTDLPGLLDKKLYPPQMHLFLLDLMRKFELCYEYYEAAGHYLVPELLGKEEPDLTGFPTDEVLRFEYNYNILPEGLLPRFIVRSRVLNTSQPRWRTGVVLQWEGNTALVKADTQDRRVSVAVAGPIEGRRRLLAVIRADFEHIHRSISKLEATEQVPVPGYQGLSIEYETLLVLETEGESEVKLVHSGKVVKVKVADLLGGVEEVRRLRGPAHATTIVNPVRIAFSYSHKDTELRDQLETHLKLLQRQGFVSSWHDRKIMEGDNWKDVIDENFKQAELILLLVSSDFMASEYCYEIEMQMALERESKGETRVVPVVLRACDWQTAPFGRLQGLPSNAKAVTSWQNRDEAWNDVANGIRRLVGHLRKHQN